MKQTPSTRKIFNANKKVTFKEVRNINQHTLKQVEFQKMKNKLRNKLNSLNIYLIVIVICNNN